jgi:Fe-S-cluster-containing dehydrogenase component
MLVSRRLLLQGALVAGAATVLPGKAQARGKVEPLEEAVGMLYDSTHCVGCRGCVAACKEANGLPWDEPSDLSNTTKSVVKTRRLALPLRNGEPSAFVKRQCMHCVDPSCVSACMLGALHKEGQGKRDMGGEREGTGIVLYDEDLCLGCRYIVKCELCRKRADPTREGALGVANPACCQVCPAGALVYGRRVDLLAEARRRMAAEPARYNGKIFGEKDGGGTQALYLAAAGVTFKELGFPDLPDGSYAQASESASHAPYLNGVAPIALYAVAAYLVRRNKKAQEGAERPEEPRK